MTQSISGARRDGREAPRFCGGRVFGTLGLGLFLLIAPGIPSAPAAALELGSAATDYPLRQQFLAARQAQRISSFIFNSGVNILKLVF